LTPFPTEDRPTPSLESHIRNFGIARGSPDQEEVGELLLPPPRLLLSDWERTTSPYAVLPEASSLGARPRPRIPTQTIGPTNIAAKIATQIILKA
jgi:hypothetical protein